MKKENIFFHLFLNFKLSIAFICNVFAAYLSWNLLIGEREKITFFIFSMLSCTYKFLLLE